MDKTEKRPTLIHVEKTQLSLIEGESVFEFQKACGDGMREHLKKKLSLADDASVYVMDLFDTHAIAEVYKGKTASTGDKWTYYGLPYVRKVDGTFEFGDEVEMARKVIYVPKAIKVTKSNGIWDGLPLS